jgi:hypothetical protein
VRARVCAVLPQTVVRRGFSQQCPMTLLEIAIVIGIVLTIGVFVSAIVLLTKDPRDLS